MRKYNISANLVCTIEQLYDKATSAVQMNGSTGEWFRTTVGVRQGCLLSPTLFNIFLGRIMPDALEDHDGKVLQAVVSDDGSIQRFSQGLHKPLQLLQS